ncbi:MAG: CHC2 zinc finger domain-containing protein [Ruminococcus sp.]|nr:CHC2 zinc finger domain-containing protein [Ruminococcus sp.]
MNEFKEIRERLNIIDVARDMGIQLDRNGMCCCPFHSEQSQSMKFYGADRDNKFYCFGCGEKGDVIDLTAKMYNIPVREAAQKLNDDYGLGITFGGRNGSDYPKREYTKQPVQNRGFAKSQTSPKPKWEKWELLRQHEYLDRERKKLAVKYIYRKPDGSKIASWKRYEGNTLVKGLNGLKMPLYHVHSLGDKSKPVFVAEGEKDVETVERLGFTATTSPNGAGSKWLDEYSKEFIGADVIILADNDEAGMKHARECAESVARYAKSVKLVPSQALYKDLQSKGDISDICSVVGSEQTKKLLEFAVRSDRFTYTANNPEETAKEQHWLNSARIVAENYLRVLNTWEKEYKNAPAGTKRSFLYNEAVGSKDTVGYFVETLSSGSREDRHKLYVSFGDEFRQMALRLQFIRKQKLDTKLLFQSETVALSKIASGTDEVNHKSKPKRKLKL